MHKDRKCLSISVLLNAEVVLHEIGWCMNNIAVAAVSGIATP